MTSTNQGSTGFLFENCEDVTLNRIRAIGCDIGIRAVDTKGLKAADVAVLSKGIIRAIGQHDPKALLLALGIPGNVPTNLVHEALTQVAQAYPDMASATKKLTESRLGEFLSSTADLVTIVQAFFQVVGTGALRDVLSCLGGGG